MASVRQYHQDSMKYLSSAKAYELSGDQEKSNDLMRRSLELETLAAKSVPESDKTEPTRSILFRSAASIALQLKEYDLSISLISNALVGNPPEEIKEELLKLFENVRYERSLAQKKTKLDKHSLLFSLSGRTVGYGFTRSSAFLERLNFLIKLLHRISERLQSVPYRASGRPSSSSSFFEPVLGAPGGGSFSITLRMETPIGGQMSLILKPEMIFEDVVKNISLVNSNEINALKKRIPDEMYFDNFLAMSKKIAPDGKNIESVALSTNTEAVIFVRPEYNIHFQRKIVEIKDEEIPFDKIGILDFASNRKDDKKVGISVGENESYDIEIVAGLDDIVVEYWRREVRVTGTLIKNTVYNAEINLVSI